MEINLLLPLCNTSLTNLHAGRTNFKRCCAACTKIKLFF